MLKGGEVREEVKEASVSLRNVSLHPNENCLVSVHTHACDAAQI